MINVITGHQNEPQKPSKRGRRRKGHGTTRSEAQAGIEQLENKGYDSPRSTLSATTVKS